MVIPATNSPLSLSAENFDAVFPFHVGFGRDWRLVHVGSSLRRTCPAVQLGASFNEIFIPHRPDVEFDLPTLRAACRTLYFIREKASNLVLRGQMLDLADSGLVLFIGSPWLTDASAISHFKLSFDDFAIHDPAVDLLHVLQAQRMAVADLKRLTNKLQDQRASLRSANERLQAAEQDARRLALIAKRTDNAVVLTSADGHIEWVNDGFVRLTGYTHEEARGKRPGDLLQGPRTDPETVRYMAQRLQNGEGFSVEIINYGKSGREYWLAIEVQPIRDASGRIANFMAIEADITARKEGERRMAMQYETSQILAAGGTIDAILPRLLACVATNLDWHAGIAWRVNAAGAGLERVETWWNPRWAGDGEAPQGVPASLNPGEGFPGRVWQQGSPAWSRDPADFAHLTQSGASKFAPTFALGLPILVDGSVWGVLEFLSQSAVAPDAELLKAFGVLGGQIGLFIKRQNTESRLRESNSLQRAILKGANYSIIATTPQGIIRTFTPGAERMLGYRADEVVGQLSPAVFHDADEVKARARELTELLGREVAPGFEAFIALARTGEHDEREWTYIRRDGTRLPVLLSISALFDDRQEITGFLGVAADITERKQAEQALIQALNDLRAAKEVAESANRAKSEFLATMSHEIRTPMNGVMGMTSLLIQSGLTPRQRELADAVSTSADSLLQVINDVLDFSKIEAGKLDISPEEFPLRPVLDGVLEVASHRDTAKDLSLAAIVDHDVPPSLIADPIRLRQVLLNLVGNGVKFTERGEVTLRVRLLARQSKAVRLRFEVRDTGPGMTEEQLERLFKPFVQSGDAGSRRAEGTGLGLAISRHLVELMGGRIGVESLVGSGSTFWFEIPLEVPAIPLEPLEPAGLPQVDVLVACSAPSLAEALREQFHAWGLPVEVVASPEDLEARLQVPTSTHSKPWWLLIDDPLLTAGGEKLRRLLSGRSQLLPTVLLARPAAAIARDRSTQSLFARILTKPVKHSQLLEWLRTTTPSGSSPAIETSVDSTHPTPHEPPAGLRSTRILLAEDNPINRRFCLLVLESLGARAEVASNGREALDRLRREHFDIVLMDCNMPEMDGYEATRAIRQMESGLTADRQRRIRIIALTANAVVGERERCLATGMDDFISKPFTTQQLKEALIRNLPSAPVPAAPPTPAAPAAASVPSLNAPRLQQLCDELDADSVRELVSDFLRELPERRRELEALQASGPLPVFRRAAHSLKGSSSSMGLDALAACCFELECAADAGQQARIDSLMPDIPRLVDEAGSALQAWLAR